MREEEGGLGQRQTAPPHQTTATAPGAKIRPLIRTRDPAIGSDREMQLVGDKKQGTKKSR